MLIQSLRNMMKPLMWATLILIIPSFIALYGYQGIKQQRAREAARALTVNGAGVDIDTYFRVRASELEGQRRNRGGNWYEGLELELGISEKVIEALVTQEILEAKARELGVYVSDKDLRETIQRMFGGENFHEAWYLYALQRSGYDPKQYEEALRWQLAADKTRELISLCYHPTEPELRDYFRKENTKFQAEFLRFQTRDYEPEVQIDQAGLEQYFAERKDKYRVPEKVRLRYLRLTPRDYESDVRVLRDDMEAYYDQNRQTYEIPERAEVEEILFPAADYVETVTSDEEALRAFFEDRRYQFRLPEKRVIEYTYIPLETEADSPQLPRDVVREYYQKHLEDYRVNVEQARAQQILLVLAPDASPGEEQEVLDRLLAVRSEIETGKPFEEAAKEFSEDKLTSEKGGDLGWFGRRNPALAGEITDLAFSLQEGEVSQPIRTSRGYHLIHLVERKPERTKPLEEVEGDIRRMLAGERLQQLRYEARELGFGEHITGATYPLIRSQPFGRRDEVIDDIIGEDTPRVAVAAFGLATGEVSSVISGRDKYYLFQLVDVRPAREQTFEEARAEVADAHVNSQAKQLAEAAAAEALAKIGAEGIPFEEVAGAFAKQVRRLGPFQKGDELPEVGEESDAFIEFILKLETGRIGRTSTQKGVHLVHVLLHEDPRIPDLEEIEERVRRSVRKEKAPAKAEEIANDVLGILEENQAGLAEAIALASQEIGLRIPTRSLGETPEIDENDPVDVTGWDASVTKAGLRLNEVGEITSDPIPVYRGAQFNEITDFFLIELLERIPEHEPDLSEVRDRVEKDYRQHLAAEMAKQKATEADQALRETVASGELAHASKTVDLVSFARRIGADYGASEQPFAAAKPGWGNPFYRAEEVLKTIYYLNAGDLSGVIEVTDEVGTGDEKEERVRGYYIVQVTDRQDANMDEFPAAREDLLMRVGRQALASTYRSWVESLKRSAEVIRHEPLQKQLAFERGEITDAEFRGETEE